MSAPPNNRSPSPARFAPTYVAPGSSSPSAEFAARPQYVPTETALASLGPPPMKKYVGAFAPSGPEAWTPPRSVSPRPTSYPSSEPSQEPPTLLAPSPQSYRATSPEPFRQAAPQPVYAQQSLPPQFAYGTSPGSSQGPPPQQYVMQGQTRGPTPQPPSSQYDRYAPAHGGSSSSYVPYNPSQGGPGGRAGDLQLLPPIDSLPPIGNLTLGDSPPQNHRAFEAPQINVSEEYGYPPPQQHQQPYHSGGQRYGSSPSGSQSSLNIGSVGSSNSSLGVVDEKTFASRPTFRKPPAPRPAPIDTGRRDDRRYAEERRSDDVQRRDEPRPAQRPAPSPTPPSRPSLGELRELARKSDSPAVLFEYARACIEEAYDINDQNMRNQLLDEGFTYLKKLANGGFADAQYFIASSYADDNDFDRAFSLYLQAAKRNHPDSSYATGRCYENGWGVKKDASKAVHFYRNAATAGNRPAMYRLGMALLAGDLSMKKDVKDAIKWLKRCAAVADRDFPHALYRLADIYEVGIEQSGIFPDPVYALNLLREAATLDFPPAQTKLGRAYESGQLGLRKDPRESIRWLTAAAKAGEADAQFSLAGWYLTGADGIMASNEQEAVRWSRMAAEQGLAKAQFAMGYFYENGTGVRRDSEESRKWYSLAAQGGDERARGKLAGHGMAVPDVNGKDKKDCIVM